MRSERWVLSCKKDAFKDTSEQCSFLCKVENLSAHHYMKNISSKGSKSKIRLCYFLLCICINMSQLVMYNSSRFKLKNLSIIQLCLLFTVQLSCFFFLSSLFLTLGGCQFHRCFPYIREYGDKKNQNQSSKCSRKLENGAGVVTWYWTENIESNLQCVVWLQSSATGCVSVLSH